MRRVLEFNLCGCTLFGTLDEGMSGVGLLIVSGGNEIRIGAHRGMAGLAQAIAAQGYPVFRFDRRGIGDSEGENVGFDGSSDDIAAAVTAFRHANPRLTNIVAFGNCDAATALVLHGNGFDALVLANPWIVEKVDSLPPPAAIKARYARRLRDLSAWRALATGKLNLFALARGLHRLVTRKRTAGALVTNFAAALARSQVPTTIIVADGDNTGMAFADAWQSAAFAAAKLRSNIKVISVSSSSHSFANDGDFDILADILMNALRQ